MKFLRDRHLRLAKVTTARWQRRAIFLLGGITVGAAAVALALLADPPGCFDETRLQALAAALGAPSLDTHLYELPLTARKRLSWLWPPAGAPPWAVLDEPSLGQDLATRVQLAAAIAQLTKLGYGVLFVTHDR